MPKTKSKSKKSNSSEKKKEVKEKSEKKASKESSEEEKSEDKKQEETQKSILQDKVLLLSLIGLFVIFGLIIFGVRNQTVEPENPVPEVETKMYNDFLFEKHGDVWVTNTVVEDSVKGWKREYEIFFHYTPDEVEDIETIRNSRGDTVSPNLFLNVNNIYITTDPEYPAEVILSGVEIAKIMGRIYEKNVKGAITRPDNRTDAPVITCEDLGPTVRVIKLELSNQTRIFSDNGCITVQGTDSDELLKASERLTYEMLKIL